MPIKLENVGIAVRDLEATIAFFTDLGLTVLGRDTVSGEWADTAVGLDGNHAKIAMLQTPDGHGRVELSRFHSPKAIRFGPVDMPSNALGLRRIMFLVEDLDDVVERLRAHGAELVREIAQYEDLYRLCFVRGPEGIVVGLSEELGASAG